MASLPLVQLPYPEEEPKLLKAGTSLTQNWDKNGKIFYTDENGDVVRPRVNPLTQFGNRLKAFGINAKNWINDENPNSEAYKQKMLATAGLLTAPLGLGEVGTAALGARLTPFLGNKIGQMAAQGIGSGLVGGGSEGVTRGLIYGENPIKTGFQDAGIGMLFGGGIGLGLGKIGQRAAYNNLFKNDSIGLGKILNDDSKFTNYFNDYVEGLFDNTPIGVTSPYRKELMRLKSAQEGVRPQEAYNGVLADTPITETEAFKTWSGNKPLVSSEEALEYPFKTGEGVTLEGFHGTKRGDRVGSEFRKDRATSGPMAFFSSNKDIAKGYAEGKADTSLIGNAWDYGNWYQYRDANGKLKPLSDAWYDLTPEERLAVSKNAPHITFDENSENIIFDPNINYGTGNYDYAIKSNKNNHLKALIDEWLQSGNLYNNEGDFYKVLEKSGINMDNINYIDPHADYSKVYDVFLSMKKPLVTNDIPTELVEKLAKEAPNHPASGMGVDMWDKNVQDGNVWIDRLKNDLAEGKSSHAWTSIPDWVTDELKNAGYDGIIDMGGKGGGQIHKVYIPFEPTQIKSVNNEGTFSLTNPNIYKSILGGLSLSELLLNNQNKNY